MKKINFNKYITKTSFDLAINENKDENLIKEIIKYLEELALNDFLEEIEFSDIHSTNFAYSWNKFVNQECSTKNDPENLMDDIERLIEKIIFFNTYRLKDKDDNEKFKFFVDFFNEGNFDGNCTPEGECFNCGKRIHLKFKNWKPTYYEYKKILEPSKYKNKFSENHQFSYLNKMDYFPADECFTELTKIKDFTFETGNLIITDWIRIKELNELVHPNANIYHFNVNSAKGRSDAFEHYLNNGLVSISSISGLDFYSLKAKDYNDCLFFGKIDYDKEPSGILNKKSYHYENQINPGLRAVTIIEKEKLIDLLNTKINNLEKTNEIVNNYLQENKSEIINKKINPGEYTIIFNLKSDNLSSLLFPKTISDKFDAKIFLYPKKLTPCLNEKPKIKI